MQEYVLWYQELGMHDVNRVGGKNASLGEMISNLANAGVKVPGGFATTAYAFNEFLEQRKLAQKLGFSASALSSWLKKSKVKFYSNDRLKVYVKNFNNVSLTFHKLSDQWVCRKHRGINRLFYSSLSSQRKSVLIADPINILSSPNLLKNIERDTLPFNLVVPLKPLSDFLKGHADTFRGRSN